MHNTLLSFEEIRPYRDDEVKEVMVRLSQKPSFKILLQYMFPDQGIEALTKGLLEIDSSDAFQDRYISKAIWNMVHDSTEGLTYEGFEQIRAEDSFFFISNHRDIILDSAFLNVLLHSRKIPTTQIAIGDNLLVSGLVTDLMKLNKSFIVHRSLARRDMIPYSQRLSAYIRNTLTKGGQSIWMAQESGRSKDGNDKTNPSLLKMLYLSSQKKDVAEGFADLQMIPMAVSYEYEPCDMLKAEELVHKAQGLPYEKDDKVGMIRGIRDNKGRVHLRVGAPLAPKIRKLAPEKRINDYLKKMANLIDREILALFKLWPNNYIAYDCLYQENGFAQYYSVTEKESFLSYMEEKLAPMKGDPALLRKQFLQIYANPVRNKLEAGFQSE